MQPILNTFFLNSFPIAFGTKSQLPLLWYKTHSPSKLGPAYLPSAPLSSLGWAYLPIQGHTVLISVSWSWNFLSTPGLSHILTPCLSPYYLALFSFLFPTHRPSFSASRFFLWEVFPFYIKPTIITLSDLFFLLLFCFLQVLIKTFKILFFMGLSWHLLVLSSHLFFPTKLITIACFWCLLASPVLGSVQTWICFPLYPVVSTMLKPRVSAQ